MFSRVFFADYLHPSTVVDCMGITPDSIDSFYNSADVHAKPLRNVSDFAGSSNIQLSNTGKGRTTLNV